MASAAFQTGTAATRSHFARAVDGLVDWMTRIGELSAGARAALRAGELAQLTDAQLAARGLKRDEIVEHAFRDLMVR